jgi:PKHD-type hydroxylase
MDFIKDKLIVPNFLTSEQCDELVKIGSAQERIKEEFGEDEGRYSYLSTITPCKIPFYEKDIHKKILSINRKHFGFKLYKEPWYNGAFLTYEKGNFTNWHIDGGVGKEYKERKFTCVILLSDRANYDGGDLEFPFYLNFTDEERALLQKGAALLFPAFMFHRVTTVTKGLRNTLTFFFEGPSLV